MTFSFFLSIYSRCGAPASWAARHTTVCLDKVMLRAIGLSINLLIHVPNKENMYKDNKRNVNILMLC